MTTIGLDGGYVRHCDAESGHNFEIIAGRVLAGDGSQRSVGFVRTVDEHSRTRVQRAVASLGGADDNLRVFTDGDGALRDLQLSVLPEATHVLDWYHLTRRLTVLASVVNGNEAAEKLPAPDQDRLSEWMDSTKWRLWHGRALGAMTRLQSRFRLADARLTPDFRSLSFHLAGAAKTELICRARSALAPLDGETRS